MMGDGGTVGAGPEGAAPARTADRVHPVRILVLSRDGDFLAALSACCCTMAAIVRPFGDADRAADELLAGDVEMAIVDADLGLEALTGFVRRVRVELCADWLPLLVAGDPLELRPRLRAAVDGMVDRVIFRALEHEELHESLASARRAVSLRRAFDSTLDRVSEAVVVIDGAARVRSFNASARRMFQWEPLEMLGAKVDRLMPQPVGQAHDGHMARYRTTGRAQVIGRGRHEIGQRRDGTQFRMHLTVSDISDSHGTRFVGVIRDLTGDQEAEELRHRVRHDALTGVASASHAREVLQAACTLANKGGERFSLIFLDLDRFKPVNDAHGHAVGDQVLQTVAHRIRRALGHRDLVARMGGDEFLVLLNGVPCRETADAVCRRLLSAVVQPIVLGGRSIDIGLSAGIAVHGPDGDSPEVLLRAADLAMYGHKRHARAARAAGPSPRPAT